MAKRLPIKARLVSEFIVEVSRLDMGIMTKGEWRRFLIEYAEALQEEIAESFASERVAGSSQLKRNTPEWNARKAKEGLDPRRGHASNNLQRTLDGRPLFQVRAVTVNKKGLGRARIHFREDWLHSRVPYAEHYEAKKVRRRGILALAKQWLDGSLAVLKAAEARAIAKRSRRSKRGAGRVASAGRARLRLRG